MGTSVSQRAQSELAAALATYRSAFAGVAVFTALLNLLYLTGSFFMLQVYDRVLPSRSVPTLVGLCVLVLALYAFQAVLDIVRSRVMARIAGGFAEQLDRRTYRLIVTLPLKAPALRRFEPARDLDQIRSFMASGGPTALFDLPWLPLYLGICYLFHPLIGVTATVGALILVAITALTELKVRRPTLEASALSAQRNALIEASRSNSEVLHAMGMVGAFADRWADSSRRLAALHLRTTDITGGLGGLSRTMRMVLQSAVLAVGAYLVIHQQATAGIIIAGSILAARALAPVEVAIGQWRVFIGARQSWQRLANLLRQLPEEPDRLALPPPQQALSVETVSVVPVGSDVLALRDVSFELTAGQGLGIIGPSASGKSTLARAIVGVWPTARGKVRLDGAPIDQWSSEALGRHVGYLPQDMELFFGTVAQNIARLDPQPPADKVIEAAKAAGIHEMILSLPKGYETEMGDGGAALSAGQRQRIGLARALYGDPFLVVLDEPNSSLDAQGDEALTQAILSVRRRRGIVVVIAHRPSALAAVDQLLLLNGGQQQAHGPKDAVLRGALRPAPVPTPAKATPVSATMGFAAPVRPAGRSPS